MAEPQHTEKPRALTSEQIPYPRSALAKYAYKTPILLYRLGLGRLAGRLFMVLTSVGRMSGLPRRTAIEYHTVAGRTYVFAAWAEADWYRNLLANPRVMVQTASGSMPARARRVTDDEELSLLFGMAARNPVIRAMARAGGWKLTRETFLAERERWILIAFDPTTEAVPQGLRADLAWTWFILTPLACLVTWLVLR
jgi:deazaflavin-dependent oxidoreductase (nitroreductase family)